MATFSQSSNSRLDTCHADLQLIMREAIKGPYDFAITCGHRPKAMQDAAYTSGASKLQWPRSKHNRIPSMAADVTIYPVDWNDHSAFALLAGWIMATAARLKQDGKVAHRLRWGGDWQTDGKTSNDRFKDFPHFELVDLV
jgi:peptidoglycan L-alanyl-D-glutamate endopeptidase CwlK